ncbi:MAG TPA: AIR synthase-related protein [Candidatus Obscuribacterales bacterium]
MSQPAASRTPSARLEIEPAATWCAAVISRCGGNSFSLYWLKVPASTAETDQSMEFFRACLTDVLSDPLMEELLLLPAEERHEWVKSWRASGYRFFAERQFLPGVTDNLAHTVQEALALKGLPDSIQVASGRAFLFADSDKSEQTKKPSDGELFQMPFNSAADVEQASCYKLFHPLTDRFAVHDLQSAGAGERLLGFPQVVLPEPKHACPVSLELSDEELERLSQDRLLALTLDEMKAIRRYFRQNQTKDERTARGLPVDPTDVELEILAQTWSEHCKHKIFNATITYSDTSKTLSQQRTTIHSLYKTYIQASTKKLSQWRKDLLSVFEDNAGVVKWDDQHAVCFKVETHNSPSALEPYGGALTGILGVNRDILGTGLGAKPIFNTDVFCFAFPSTHLPNRPKLLPPKAILDGVRKGVEDGGNKSGIPTVNGAIFFDPGYRAKPLVYCGTGGLLPLSVTLGGASVPAHKKHTQVGDTIVMVGGRVGKDGIHGATFSSESLHEGSPMSAVQIGDPFTQKRVLDFILEARDLGLITGITDNGAGGLSSSVGEMARLTGGASIELEGIPTKYPGLSDWEIVVSESQERMTVSTRDFEALSRLAEKHHVEISNIGQFHDRGYFEVTRAGKPVALLALDFLHDGVPTLDLQAMWSPSQITMKTGKQPANLNDVLLKLLRHPNISSREAIIRQYDHEVQGMSVIKPLMGPRHKAPCDAAVIIPVYGSQTGLAISNGICPRLSAHDTYVMAVCAVDEAVRNAVCVGADPDSLCLLDNFCWPDPVYSARNLMGKKILGELVRACEGLHDAVLAYRAPLISGKDSMKNNFDDGTIKLAISPTLLVSLMGKVPDVSKCVSMEFKEEGDCIYLIAAGLLGLAGSHYEELEGWQTSMLPSLDLDKAPRLYRSLHTAIKESWVKSAHDLSEGGLAVALAECVLGGGAGAAIELQPLVEHVESIYKPKTGEALRYLEILVRVDSVLFGEGPAHILVSVDKNHEEEWRRLFADHVCIKLGEVTSTRTLTVNFTTGGESGSLISASGEQLEAAWSQPLPFD